MREPVPQMSLEYDLYGKTPYLPPGCGSVPIAEVRTVRITRHPDHRQPDGRPALWVYAYGRMLKKDGTIGRGRESAIDLSVDQPYWLEEIIRDAERRLA